MSDLVGVVDVARVQPFIKAFRRLDVTADGHLNEADLKLLFRSFDRSGNGYISFKGRTFTAFWGRRRAL